MEQRNVSAVSDKSVHDYKREKEIMKRCFVALERTLVSQSSNVWKALILQSQVFGNVSCG